MLNCWRSVSSDLSKVLVSARLPTHQGRHFLLHNNDVAGYVFCVSLLERLDAVPYGWCCPSSDNGMRRDPVLEKGRHTLFAHDGVEQDFSRDATSDIYDERKIITRQGGWWRCCCTTIIVIHDKGCIVLFGSMPFHQAAQLAKTVFTLPHPRALIKGIDDLMVVTVGIIRHRRRRWGDDGSHRRRHSW